MAHHLPHAGGAVAADIPAGPRGRFAALQALQNRDYRFLWLGQLGQSASLWVETVARSWLVWELTGSATALGTVNLLRSLPMLIFGILAGAAADRMDKKRLLTICQTFTMLNLLSLAVMIRTDNLQLWAVYLTSFLMGSSMAFLQPTRTSLIPSLVKREELTNAVALNNAAMNVTRIMGPALAGILIPVIGIDGIYFSAAAFYLWTIWSTNQIRVKTDTATARKDSVWGSIKEGMLFCWRDKTILTLMMLALIPMTFGMPY
ncbi:MAG: MFS transporter, partial [Chloroflexi bacterium]|nr:MFS transporter [Chloroflexota bacterium]